MKEPVIVDIYFNLNTHKWSLRHKGRVVHHAQYVEIKPTAFHVGQSGRKRVVKEKRKNVHAWIKGELITLDEKKRRSGNEISYDPYAWGLREEGFFFDSKGREVFPEDFSVLYFDFETKKVYGKK